jgi:hypothetical protein
MKKKDYINPEMTVIELLPQQIICTSKGAYNYNNDALDPDDIGIDWGPGGLLGIDDV